MIFSNMMDINNDSNAKSTRLSQIDPYNGSGVAEPYLDLRAVSGGPRGTANLIDPFVLTPEMISAEGRVPISCIKANGRRPSL